MAVLAFSGASFAKTGEVEIKTIYIELARDCDQEGINARDCSYEVNGGDYTLAQQVGYCVTEKCQEQEAALCP